MSKLPRGLVISISGPHGSGKSTYAKALADEFGLRLVSAGSVFRQIARERRVSPIELGKIARNDRSIDLLVDERIKREAKKGSVVVEGHLTGWTTKNLADLRIYLRASDEVRLERVARREKMALPKAKSTLLDVERVEVQRWKRLYGIDPRDLSIYDLVLSTEIIPLELNVKILKEIVRGYISNKGY